MIGPTGVGKTEIARRLAKLANSPFIKVEASKFTEVGYVGREVDSIIRDLLDMAIKLVREDQMEKVRVERPKRAAEERVLDALIPPTKVPVSEDAVQLVEDKTDGPARKKFRRMLREGVLDKQEIDIDVSTSIGVEIFGPPGLEEMTNQLQSMMQSMGSQKKPRAQGNGRAGDETADR